MITKLRSLKYICIIILLFTYSISQAQDIPFNCDYNAYLFQYNDVYSIDLASGNSYLVAEDVTPGNINAAAYNSADGFIWGSLTSPAKTIVRIGKNFATTTYYIDELPTSSRYVGGISIEGIYYLKGGGKTYYKIDLDPDSDSYTKHLGTETLSQNINIHDWAFNAVDNMFYTVEKGTNNLYRINPTTSNVESMGEVPILSGLNYTYGAVYFDASGRFYVSANETGTIYVIQNVQDLDGSNTMDSNLFAFGPSSSSNDGARCPTAPVPQEICDNGIDDDGDGLIDCEDPSCSGYGKCAVIEPSTSRANDGGLESNNRLSDKINKRNFNRVKNTYTFDSKSAKKLLKSTGYAKKKTNTEIQLADFIPLTVIKEDSVIESTPTDLLGITNATDVYAVDYIRNDKPVASILLLKTENGVYEHTKYICDRLLGAELISVSTIDINEHSFIKSLIKNADNTVEFVLSFSAKKVNNDTNFAIESHWNLDNYEIDKTFYNFQIWSNSLDDLYRLGEEAFKLLEVEKPISDYNNSAAPTVFVRKGKYINGALSLQIINTNASDQVLFDAGVRSTETSEVNQVTSSIELGKEYITDLEVETGNLFDVGFRIGDGVATPDDLFMSDGPWGIDDSAESTEVNKYNVTPNVQFFNTNDFPVERNVELEAKTSEFVAVYRALTPRFKAVNLSDYNSFKLSAKGTGNLEVVLVRQSISNWDEQYKANIQLTDENTEFSIPFSSFKSSNDKSLVLDDVVTIVFIMVSEDGTVAEKSMNLQEVRFSQDEEVAIIEEINATDALIASPNPMLSTTSIQFAANTAGTVDFIIHDQTGKVVYLTSLETKIGTNELTFNKENLSTGLYFCTLSSSKKEYAPLKLIVQ